MKPITRRVTRRVAASSLLLLLTAAAQAAIYSGRFDPMGRVSDGFPGFNGIATFDVSNNCLDQGNGFFFTGSSGDCGAAFMTSARVNLYDPTSPDTAEDPVTAPHRVDFFTLGSFSLLGVLVDNGKVVGVDTDIMGPAITGNDYLPYWTATTQFWLQFQSCLPNPGQCSDPAYIYRGDIENRVQSDPALTVTFTAVPEPSTWTLVLGAIGLGWLVRRRNPSQPTRMTAAGA